MCVVCCVDGVMCEFVCECVVCVGVVLEIYCVWCCVMLIDDDDDD